MALITDLERKPYDAYKQCLHGTGIDDLGENPIPWRPGPTVKITWALLRVIENGYHDTLWWPHFRQLAKDERRGDGLCRACKAASCNPPLKIDYEEGMKFGFYSNYLCVVLMDHHGRVERGVDYYHTYWRTAWESYVGSIVMKGPNHRLSLTMSNIALQLNAICLAIDRAVKEMPAQKSEPELRHAVSLGLVVLLLWVSAGQFDGRYQRALSEGNEIVDAKRRGHGETYRLEVSSFYLRKFTLAFEEILLRCFELHESSWMSVMRIAQGWFPDIYDIFFDTRHN